MFNSNICVKAIFKKILKAFITKKRFQIILLLPTYHLFVILYKQILINVFSFFFLFKVCTFCRFYRSTFQSNNAFGNRTEFVITSTWYRSVHISPLLFSVQNSQRVQILKLFFKCFRKSNLRKMAIEIGKSELMIASRHDNCSNQL